MVVLVAVAGRVQALAVSQTVVLELRVRASLAALVCILVATLVAVVAALVRSVEMPLALHQLKAAKLLTLVLAEQALTHTLLGHRQHQVVLVGILLEAEAEVSNHQAAVMAAQEALVVAVMATVAVLVLV